MFCVLGLKIGMFSSPGVQRARLFEYYRDEVKFQMQALRHSFDHAAPCISCMTPLLHDASILTEAFLHHEVISRQTGI